MQFDQKKKALIILLCTEMPELFGRFSISALLVLYLTKSLHFSDVNAFSIYSAFIALIFVTPIIGGYFSDKLLGHRDAIIFGGLIMGIGNLFMVIANPNMVYLWPSHHHNW